MIIVTDLGKFRSVRGLLNYMLDNQINEVYVDHISIGQFAPDYVLQKSKKLNDVYDWNDFICRA